jgi:hypothetical protein
MSTIKVAIIPADETKEVEYKEIENTLKAKQQIVGGLIEAVRLREHGQSVAMDFYCNDDFHSLENPQFNRRASLLYTLSFGMKGYICGDVVVIGGVDQHGNDKGLGPRQERHLRGLFDLDADDWMD